MQFTVLKQQQTIGQIKDVFLKVSINFTFVRIKKLSSPRNWMKAFCFIFCLRKKIEKVIKLNWRYESGPQQFD